MLLDFKGHLSSSSCALWSLPIVPACHSRAAFGLGRDGRDLVCPLGAWSLELDPVPSLSGTALGYTRPVSPPPAKKVQLISLDIVQ
jgi:hypothetical protein